MTIQKGMSPENVGNFEANVSKNPTFRQLHTRYKQTKRLLSGIPVFLILSST